MKTIICLYIIMLLGILQGCDSKCCDCDKITSDEQGNLRLVRSWENLWDGIPEPDGLDVYFYSQFQDLQYQRVCVDTTNLFLIGGEYNVLAINNNDYISGIGDFHTAKISLPCQKINNKYVTTEVPLTVATSCVVFVDNSRISDCLVAPYPIVSIINFRFDIKTDSLIGEIKECKANLNGVITSKMLSGEKDTASISASLPFTTVETVKGIFDKKISILGLSGIGNKLDISVVCGNEMKAASVDLTNLFDFSLSPIQNCVIQIYLNADLATAVIEDVSITDWSQGNDGNIELKNK